MHWHDRPGPGRDLLLDFRRIDGLVVPHVGINRGGADMGDRTGRSDERNWRRDHLVTATDAHRPQADHQSIGAGIQGNAVSGAGVTANLALDRKSTSMNSSHYCASRM